ncbi:unnamed protein product [Coffea canephora]|uniref:Derlin n=1 Tax=Coffea canephora TaxID=49390 RepID=A0A068UAQ5_COFCA|nr:unnamed protein product [Coffea canephora]
MSWHLRYIYIYMYGYILYYRSLPPVAKTYTVACLMTTVAFHMELYEVSNIALYYSDVFKRFQVWRLITNFFFLGGFSLPFGFRILTILYYGVSLERGAFDKRTADYVWMFVFGAISLLVMAAIPLLWSPFKGPAMVFMIVYVWSRENPNARVNIQGLVEIKGFYLPWVMLGIDTILGHPWMPAIQGIAAGHIYYFCTVLYPLSTGKNYFKTPLWVHKLVAFWGEGYQLNAPVRQDPDAGVAFRGRSYRLGGPSRGSARPPGSSSTSSAQEGPNGPAQPTGNTADGVAFRGRSHRLGAR